MKPKIVEIVENLSLNLTADQAEELANAIIEECMYAVLINYDGKINPIAIKEILDDHFGINKFYFDPNQ